MVSLFYRSDIQTQGVGSAILPPEAQRESSLPLLASCGIQHSLVFLDLWSCHSNLYLSLQVTFSTVCVKPLCLSLAMAFRTHLDNPG